MFVLMLKLELVEISWGFGLNEQLNIRIKDFYYFLPILTNSGWDRSMEESIQLILLSWSYTLLPLYLFVFVFWIPPHLRTLDGKSSPLLSNFVKLILKWNPLKTLFVNRRDRCNWSREVISKYLSIRHFIVPQTRILYSFSNYKGVFCIACMKGASKLVSHREVPNPSHLNSFDWRAEE